jgi:hypothetical protein
MVLVIIVLVIALAVIGFAANKFSNLNREDPLMDLELPPSINPPEAIWAGDSSADIFSCIMMGFRNTEVLWDIHTGSCTLRTIDVRSYPISIKLSPIQVRELVSIGRTGYRMDSQRVVDALCTILRQKVYISVEFVEATGEGQGLSEEVSTGAFLWVNIT